MMVEKRQSSSRAVQGYTTGCSPAPEPPASLGKALSSWRDKTGSEEQEARGREAPCGVRAGPPCRFSPPKPSQPWALTLALCYLGSKDVSTTTSTLRKVV